jgi:hypothetical protein
MKLTENFTYEEMIASQEATRSHISEQFNPPQSVKDNLKRLCVELLQPLRTRLSPSIRISSGYRCEKLNAAIGGSKTSDHVGGNAADCNYYFNNKENNLKLAIAVMESGLSFKQMILEGGTMANPRWIHLSYDPTNNKKEILYASFATGKAVYSKLKFTNGTFVKTT